MRALILAIFLVAVSLTGVLAQTPGASPSLSISYRVGGPNTEHDLHGTGFPVSASVPVMLFDPAGNENVLQAQTDTSGAFTLSLSPSAAPWRLGLYRVAVGLSGGRAESVTFVVSDGAPHLFALPDLPSPTSAVNLVGIGLPANTALTLELDLTGGQQSARQVQATTDADGVFSLYVWPDQFGLPFFAAGDYRVAIPSLGLATPFRIREHPVSAAVSVTGPVPSSGSLPIHLRYYAANRYIWGIYQGASGQPGGEFLVGPTDARGDLDTVLQLGALAPGHYYLATPFDWGETSFDVPAPTATATLLPTATSVPTATATPKPTPTKRAKPKPTATKTKTAKPKPTATRTKCQHKPKKKQKKPCKL